jgi:hypothetical protein
VTVDRRIARRHNYDTEAQQSDRPGESSFRPKKERADPGQPARQLRSLKSQSASTLSRVVGREPIPPPACLHQRLGADERSADDPRPRRGARSGTAHRARSALPRHRGPMLPSDSLTRPGWRRARPPSSAHGPGGRGRCAQWQRRWRQRPGLKGTARHHRIFRSRPSGQAPAPG